MRSVRGKTEAEGSREIIRLNLAGVSVFIAMPTHRDLPPRTAVSLLKTQHALDTNNIPCEVLIEPGFSIVEVARSMCVHRFLLTPATKMFWIDSDMAWEPDAFMRTLALSGKVDAVCGAYPTKEEPPRFNVGTPGRVTMNEYGCIPCRGGGLGFTIVNRNVIEHLAAKAPTITYPLDTQPPSDVKIRHLFSTGRTEGGAFLGEDTAFFRDIEEAGFKCWCDPSLVLGHIGPKVYEGSFYDYTFAQQVAAE
jgi:hypothetical protein